MRDPHATIATSGPDAGRMLAPRPALRTLVRRVMAQPADFPMLTVSGPRGRRIVHVHSRVQLRYLRQPHGANAATFDVAEVFGFLTLRPATRSYGPLQRERLDGSDVTVVEVTAAGREWAR